MMISVPVADESQVAVARREAVAIAQQQGFDESDLGRVALVTTELATNLIKHGGGGEILAGAFEEHGVTGFEAIALDQGRGMVNVQACLADGYSSAGTAGHGLGAVIRQSDFFDIASWPGVGTAVLARIAPRGTSPFGRESPRSSFGAVSIAKEGEAVCGDSWAIDRDDGVATLLVADGLGHGEEAANASVEAVRVFRRHHRHQAPTLLDYVHGGLRATRGAAVSIARVDIEAGRVDFAGIGNVAGILAWPLRRMVSMPGTAGYNVRKIQSFQYAFSDGLVILCSDGISTSLTLDRYPNLAAAQATLIAAVLYRDFGRRRDDATVLVGKWTRQ